MSVDLRGRSFLKLLDYTPSELHHLIDLAASLKAAKADGTEVRRVELNEEAVAKEPPAAISFYAHSNFTMTITELTIKGKVDPAWLDSRLKKK